MNLDRDAPNLNLLGFVDKHGEVDPSLTKSDAEVAAWKDRLRVVLQRYQQPSD
jgi:hypothetical protein